jgi:ADP-heptose:LPS heptosyltransferase
LDHYVKLAEALVEAGVPITLAGGPADDWVCPAFAHLPVRNLVGQTDLTGMVELLSQAAVVVTHDSGPLHLATITRAGLVTLFGPTPANACIPLGRPRRSCTSREPGLLQPLLRRTRLRRLPATTVHGGIHGGGCHAVGARLAESPAAPATEAS